MRHVLPAIRKRGAAPPPSDSSAEPGRSGPGARAHDVGYGVGVRDRRCSTAVHWQLATPLRRQCRAGARDRRRRRRRNGGPLERGRRQSECERARNGLEGDHGPQDRQAGRSLRRRGQARGGRGDSDRQRDGRLRDPAGRRRHRELPDLAGVLRQRVRSKLHGAHHHDRSSAPFHGRIRTSVGGQSARRRHRHHRDHRHHRHHRGNGHHGDDRGDGDDHSDRADRPGHRQLLEARLVG